MSEPRLDQTIMQLLVRLWFHIAIKRKQQIALLFTLMILSVFAEILSIGSIIPFLAVLTGPDRVFDHVIARPFIELLGFTAPEQLLLPLTMAFGIAAVFAGGIRLLLLWATTKLSFSIGADLSLSIYKRTLYQPYSVHVARNSSEVISGISTKANAVIATAVAPTLTLMSSSLMLIAIIGVLLSVSPHIALLSFGILGAVYVLIIRKTRAKLNENSRHISKEITLVFKALQEGLGGIRDVLIDGSQESHCQLYRNADLPYRKAQASNVFISQSPRYLLEVMGILVLATLAYVMSQRSEGLSDAIPLLGVFALGAQRLLPLMQQSYAAWSSMQGGRISLQDALDLLDQPLPSYLDLNDQVHIPFQKRIEFKNLSFRYNKNSPYILRDLNFSIPKGSRIGLVGATGCGKSTILDLIMGLLEPTNGQFKVDGQSINLENCKSWQSHLAHVPQAIFLADASILENIAFGQAVSEIDSERAEQAARQARIVDDIESWPLKYQTVAGERGVRLSGGQRQRIGIARALYKQADVIIFDEATSSLDDDTENSVMRAIDGLSHELTLIIVAHRLTTLKNCTEIIEIANGHVICQGTYDDLITKKSPGIRG